MLDLMVTLWPSMPHFERFVFDPRLSGIRLNSAMISSVELDKELALLKAYAHKSPVPLWFDIKGRQPRVVEVHPFDDHLEITLNHRIRVPTPVPVLFKAGEDHALLVRIEGAGQRLIFAPGKTHGPMNLVRPGESLHIRHPNFKILGPLFTEEEHYKIAKVKAAGITKWFLSYVELSADIVEFLELVGKDAEVMLKIESKRGLDYVIDGQFHLNDHLYPHLNLCAARGDLYVEIDKPHMIAASLRQIIKEDPEALVGSRMLLSTILNEVPSCADFLEMEWLADIGYKRMMLCDEICLKENLLARAVAAFTGWRMERL